MRAIRLAWYELARFRRPLQRLSLAFLLLVPTIYGAIYLWTNWDPYGRLDQVPVAVVNQDRPVTVDRLGGGTERVDAGGMFVRQLREEPIFQWHFVNQAEALDGQSDGRYYLVITVPRDFSARLTSGASGAPQRAAMSIRLDDGNGYIVGIMAETVQSELERQISAAAVTAYFQSALGGLDALSDGLNDAAKGAGELRDGLATEREGTRELVTGLERLKAGSSELVPGSQQVADGVHEIASVTVPLADDLSAGVPGLAKAADDAAELADTLSVTAAEGSASVASRAERVRTQAERLAEDRPQVANSAAYTSLMSAVREVGAAADEIATRAAELKARVEAIGKDAETLRAGAPELRKRLKQAATDMKRLDAGAARVASGVRELDSGIGDALAGARRLDAGARKLHDGAGKLADGLDTMRDRLPNLDAGQRAKAAATLASPVDVRVRNAHPAYVYGRGLTPFFFAIALWVFGIVALLLLRPYSGRVLAGTGISPLSTALASWLPIGALSVLGGWLLFLVVDVALGLDPVNLAGLLGVVALGALSFTALVHLIRVAFGGVGDAIALVLLIVQLVSCGGLYPVETLPLPFRVIHPVLPMSQIVDALRVVVSGGNAAHAWRAVLVLLLYLLAALALTAFVLGRDRVWTMSRLKPTLQI